MSEEYQSGSKSIPGYGPVARLESEEIYAPGCPPILATGMSMSGKTVMCTDMVYSNRHRVTGFTLFTNSYHAPSNQYLREMIPEIFVKNWDLRTLCLLWGDILERSASINRALSKVAVERFIAGRCQGNAELERKIHVIDEMIMSNRSLFDDETELRLAADAQKKSQMIEFIRDHFDQYDQTLSDEERATVRAAKSSLPCHILIFDDITDALTGKISSSEAYDVPSITESGEIKWEQYKGPMALEKMLVSLLTLSRHYAIVAFFVHYTTGLFSASIRRLFGAVALLNEKAVEEACNQRVYSSDVVDLIRGAHEIAKEYPYHKIVFFPNVDITTHGQKIAIFKSRYHSKPQPIGVPTYQMLITNIQLAIKAYQSSGIERARIEQEKARIKATGDALIAAAADPSTAYTSAEYTPIPIPPLTQGVATSSLESMLQ